MIPVHLIIICGIPASGKTTLSKRIMADGKYDFYSFDDLGCFMHRELIPYIKQSLSAGKNVLVDSTYSRRSIREELLVSLAECNCKKTIIFLDTPIEECVRRNKQRRCTVPECLVTGIHKAMQPPTYEEGWDEIIYM